MHWAGAAQGWGERAGRVGLTFISLQAGEGHELLSGGV